MSVAVMDDAASPVTLLPTSAAVKSSKRSAEVDSARTPTLVPVATAVSVTETRRVPLMYALIAVPTT